MEGNPGQENLRVKGVRVMPMMLEQESVVEMESIAAISVDETVETTTQIKITKTNLINPNRLEVKTIKMETTVQVSTCKK